METVGNRLKYARKEIAKITQERLASMAGISQQTLQKLESNKCNTTRYGKELSFALGVNISWLLLGVGSCFDNISKISFIHYKRIPIIDLSDCKYWGESTERGYMLNPKTNFVLSDVKDDGCFGIEIKDDVMNHCGKEIYFESGSRIICNPNKKYEEGSYVVAHIHKNEETIIREVISKNDEFYLKSPNIALPEIKIDENIKICGVITQKVTVQQV